MQTNTLGMWRCRFEQPNGTKPQPEVMAEPIPQNARSVNTHFRKVAPMQERCGVVYGAKPGPYEHRFYAVESAQATQTETAAGSAGRAPGTDWPVHQYTF